MSRYITILLRAFNAQIQYNFFFILFTILNNLRSYNIIILIQLLKS